MTATDGAGVRRPWLAFGVATAIACLTALDLSKINVALPAIEAALGGGSSDLQLIVVGYVLVLGVLLVPSGRLGDLTSRRRIFLIGIAAFGATSAMCALAPDTTWLLVGRLLQGFSAALISPQVLGIIQRLFSGPSRASAFGYFGAVMGIAMSIGPAVGGALAGIDPEHGWRWIFGMNVPLAVILLVPAWRLLPPDAHRTEQRIDLDPVGMLLLALAVSAVLLPFVAPADWDARRWLALPAAALLAVALAAWELRRGRRGRAQLLQPALFAIRSFRTNIAVGFTSFAAIGGVMIVFTLHLQEGLGLSPLLAGAVMGSFAAASAVTSWFAGPIVVRLHGRTIVLAVGTMLGATLVLLALVLARLTDAEVWFLLGTLIVLGAAGGVNLAANQTLMLAEVPVADGGVAASIGQVGQRVGTAIGISVSTAAYFHGRDLESTTTGMAESLVVVAVLLVAALAVAMSDRPAARASSTATDPAGSSA